MLTSTKESMLTEIHEYAEKNILKKLKQQGINRDQLNDSDFDSLVQDEIEILKSDSKKVIGGVAIGILISLLTGI